MIRLPDIAFGAEAWALVELEIPAGLAVENAGQLLQAAVTASTPEGEPLAFADALLTLPAMPVSAWETVLNDPLVVTRQAELAAAKLLEQARNAAEHGDWNTVERLLAEARQRFADQPWVIEVLREHGGTRPFDGYGPLPQGGALLVPQDEFADFGEGRRHLDVAC